MKRERDGLWKDYDTEGNLLWEYIYENGKFHGTSIFYHSNGQILCKGYYKNGYQDGLWEWFDEHGKLTKSVSHMASKNKEKQRPERRDLGDEIIQIMNRDLKAEMFEIDKKDFESREAFFNADIKVRKKYYKAGYSYNPYFNFLKTMRVKL